MMTSSNGNIFCVTGPLCGEFTGPGEFPTQRPVTRSFDVFFDLRPIKRLSKQWRGWWFETLSRPFWRHRNAYAVLVHYIPSRMVDLNAKKSHKNVYVLLSGSPVYACTQVRTSCFVWIQHHLHMPVHNLHSTTNEYEYCETIGDEIMLSSGVALFSKTAPGHRLSEQLLQHVYVYWLTHSVELHSKEIALCSQKRQHPAPVNGHTKFHIGIKTGTKWYTLQRK